MRTTAGNRLNWQAYTVAVATPVLLTIAAVQQSGSSGHLVAALNGQRLLVTELEVLKISDDVNTVRAHIENISSTDVRIVGCHSSCRCMASSSLPVTIAPGRIVNLDFEVTCIARRDFTESVTLLTVPAGTPVTLSFRSER